MPEQTGHQRVDGGPLADRIAILLERLGRLIVQDAHADGLNPVQWETLRYLARANRFSRTPSALTAYLGSTRGTVSQTVIALERKGCVRKVRSKEDKRSVRLDLTEEGQEKIGTDPLSALAEIIEAGSSPEGLQHLAHGLGKILEERLRRRGGRPFGLCASCRHFERQSPDGDPHRCSLLGVPLTGEDATKICAEQEPVDP